METATNDSPNEQLLSIYSDMYKAAYGHRPGKKKIQSINQKLLETEILYLSGVVKRALDFEYLISLRRC